MFQLVLLAAILYILVQWLRRGSPPAEKTRRSGPPPPAVDAIEEMVQDPACGTWVPASQALSVQRGKEALYFCSVECRDKFLAGQGRDK